MRSLGKGTKPAREAARKDQHRRKGADEWTSGRRDDGGRKGGKKGSKGSKPEWHGEREKGGNGNKGKGKGKGKSETRYGYNGGEQGHVGTNCPHKWTNNIDEEMTKARRGIVSLKGRKQKNSRVWRRPMTEQDHQMERALAFNACSSPSSSAWYVGIGSTRLRQVADVRRPLVSASHIIQARNDLFIGEDEAYTMNRKKMDMAVVRKEGKVYVLVS